MGSAQVEELMLIFISVIVFAVAIGVVSTAIRSNPAVSSFVLRAAKSAFSSASKAISSAVEGLLSSVANWF